MPRPVFRAPNLPSISATTIRWLTEPAHQPLASQVGGWDDADWETARWAIQVHGIAPLLDRAAASWPDAHALHPRLRAYLSDQRRLSAARVARLLGELAEILAALQAAGVAALPLKGSLLATRYYPEPGLRPMNDLDLLVRPEDEPRALAALAELGYRLLARSWKHTALARPDGSGPTVSFDGEHPDNPRSLDLHTRLYEQFWSIRYDLSDRAWPDSSQGQLLGQPARLMRPSLLLQHLAIHTSCDMIARRVRLLHLQDIALVAREVAPRDWEGMLAHVRSRREERFVYPALAMASRYYPAVPELVLRALRPGVPEALLQHLQATDLDRHSFCNAAPTTPAEKLRWFRPGAEQALALRHMLVPDPGELGHWYPRLARPALLPVAYMRYAAELLGWGVRRALGKPRRKLAEPMLGVEVNSDGGYPGSTA
jgi:hypothetical protein